MWPFRKSKSSDEPAHLRAGRWGEELAAKYLRRHGYKILETRIRVGRRDELDIIAREGDILVFVEVKTRATERMGRPVESVKKNKRDALARAAMRYMKRLRRKPPQFRFDVVEVIGREGEGVPEVRHLTNVFTLPKSYRVSW